MPLLQEVGKRWHEGRLSIWQEHLLSEVVSSTTGIFTRIAETSSGNGGFLFATPPHEEHAFGIAFAAMLASAHGLRAHNLGASVPAPEVVAAAKGLNVGCVVVGITLVDGSLPELEAYLDELDRGLPAGVEIRVGGQGSIEVVRRVGRKRVRAIPTLEAFDAVIAPPQ